MKHLTLSRDNFCSSHLLPILMRHATPLRTLALAALASGLLLTTAAPTWWPTT